PAAAGHALRSAQRRTDNPPFSSATPRSSTAPALLSHELLFQIHEAQCPHLGRLLVVSRRGVTTFVVLEERHVVALPLHARRHLARVYRGHAIIAGSGDEQHWWIFPVGTDVLVGRVLEDPGTVGRASRVTVLGLPGCPRADLRVSNHVDQRHLAN